MHTETLLGLPQQHAARLQHHTAQNVAHTRMGLSTAAASRIHAHRGPRVLGPPPTSSPQLLAGAGNFAKAFGKGVGRPAFRVIQTHFAAGNNVGDVAAKEEVWEVAGQLTGLACSVAVLRALQPLDSAEAVLAVWLVVHSVHVVLRWQVRRTYVWGGPCTCSPRAYVCVSVCI